MKNHCELHVPAGQKKERLDIYIVNRVENATRSKVQEAIRAGEILVNGKEVKSSYTVLPLDRISIDLNRPDPPEVKAENIPLDILYEDRFLLVVNKPPGMVTHPAYKNYSGTLVNALMHHADSLSMLHTKQEGESEFIRPGIVHRLDKNTSGLLVIAKDESTHAILAKQFADKSSERIYHAIVWGGFAKKSGSIVASLGRSKSDRKKITVDPAGKYAETAYEVLEKFEYLSYISLRLKTGRTHQIRVHMAHLHHPVFGDETYGGRGIHAGGIEGKKKAEVKNLLEMMPRQALHAKTLGFIHPEFQTMMRFDSELPDDMQELLRVLRAR